MSEHETESKFISYCLRHGADKIKLAITKEGWVKVTELIEKAKEAGYALNQSILEQIVKEDSKGRYSFNNDNTMIRANQGHSLAVNPGLKKMVPPIELFHGTSEKALNEIKKKGIQKMSRTHVHLSDNIKTAHTVGRRHGRPVIITVDCKAMLTDGIDFFMSENCVWLTDFVDPKYFKEIL